MEKTILTAEGKKQLEARLNHLKMVERPENIKRIGEARDFGDLSENAEYDAAKKEQARIELEVGEIESKLRDCVVIDDKHLDTSKVNLGCFVKIFDEEFNEEVEYKIVGSTESNPAEGKISNESPVGRALLGKKVGEVATICTPVGTSLLKIVSIRA